MKYFTRRKLFVGFVILLTVINLASLSTILYITNNPPKEDGRFFSRNRDERRNDQCEKPEARKFFRELHAQFKKRIEPEAKRMKRTQSLMMNELIKDYPNRDLLDSLAQESGLLHTRIKRNMIDIFQEVNAEATPDEQKYLKAFYRKFIFEDHLPPRDDHPRRKRKNNNENGGQ